MIIWQACSWRVSNGGGWKVTGGIEISLPAVKSIPKKRTAPRKVGQGRKRATIVSQCSYLALRTRRNLRTTVTMIALHFAAVFGSIITK
ncbi:hypothetical protein TNCV_2715851 [Trichonephila clavipes]|nr:hypothetical protein TNCV_2715851 [Trichonephila clavipes]